MRKTCGNRNCPNTSPSRLRRATSPQGEALGCGAVPQARWTRRLGCLRRGTFPRGEEFPKRAGGCGPRTPFGCAACIPGRGIARAAALLRAVPSGTPYPFNASRGTVESDNRYGYTTFLKGRTGCLRTGRDAAHGSIHARIPHPNRRGGLYARPYPGGDSRRSWMVLSAVGSVRCRGRGGNRQLAAGVVARPCGSPNPLIGHRAPGAPAAP